MSDPIAERVLLETAIGGDASAVEQLLLAYYTRLEQYVEKKIPDRARRHFSADDILQLVFAHVFRDIRRFELRVDGSFFGWLKIIADHRLIDALRRIDRGAAKQVPIQPPGRNSIADVFDIIYQESDSPSRIIHVQEAIHAMHIAIAGLPEEQQEAIRLHFLEQKPLSEVACETGRTEAAVRGLIHRGKKNLEIAMGRASRWFSG